MKYFISYDHIFSSSLLGLKWGVILWCSRLCPNSRNQNLVLENLRNKNLVLEILRHRNSDFAAPKVSARDFGAPKSGAREFAEQKSGARLGSPIGSAGVLEHQNLVLQIKNKQNGKAHPSISSLFQCRKNLNFLSCLK